MAKILLIDDERQFCELLAYKIRQLNHEVACAFTMQDGLQKAESGDCDVVYLDVNLPDGNGLAEEKTVPETDLSRRRRGKYVSDTGFRGKYVSDTAFR